MHGFLPANFWPSLLGTTIYAVLGLALMVAAFVVTDRITPGHLGNQLLGSGRPDGKPNVALGLVAAGLLVGMGFIIAAAVH